tara:strand:- start:123416 stop:124228 length:813 start_codon:yes stop_codon:yes gene_type:complete
MKRLLSSVVCVGLAACGGSNASTSDGGPGDNTADGALNAPDANTSEGSTFTEDDGYVVMEMESTAVPAGHEWQLEDDLSGYTGDGFYRFTGNNICSGPASSPLRYDFTTTSETRFELRLRAAKIAHCVAGEPQENGQCSEDDRTCDSLGEPNDGGCGTSQCIRTDISNDAFIYIETADGEYVSFVDQPANTIGEGVKLFGGQVNSWGWTGVKALDPGGPKLDAHWDLSPGRYSLVIQGRSAHFRIDRIALFDSVSGTIDGLDERAETRTP